MKKTVIINIGNSIIHIEEDAYEVLTTYLNEIKQHFAKNADDFEIVKDIENRIAEMFAEILQIEQKKVVELKDVQNVIAQMGSVSDFVGEEEQENQQTSSNPFDNYRTSKRLFRDTDEGVIAGVCAGLGYYLNIEARWIRLAFFLTIFLGGAGILAYGILWIAIPRAKNRAEKMAMKGEAANLYAYKKSFEEELAAFKENMKYANEQFRPIVKHSGNFITNLIKGIGKMIAGIWRFFLKIFAALVIVFGFGLLVCLIACLAAFLGLWDSNAYDYFPFSIINVSFRNELVLATFITVFIPVLTLVLLALRTAFKKVVVNRTVYFTLLIIWLVGVSSSVYYAVKISSEFQDHAELVQSYEIKTYPTYVIDVDKSIAFSKEDSLNYHLNEKSLGNRIVVDNDGDHPFRGPENVHLSIEKSDNNKTTMIQTYKSKGKNFQIALQNAQNIDYKYKQKDSLLILNPRLQLKNQSVWRNQEVHITLKVPVGTKLLINDNLYQYLQFYYYSCDNYDSQSDYRVWIMTEEGLKCKSDLDKPKEDPAN